MSYQLCFDKADSLFEHLRKDYRIFAPKRFPKQGRYSDTDIIRYAEIDHIGQIVWDHKSTYAAKEVVTPITQTLFYFTEDDFKEATCPEKPILVFARPCDINAQINQDKIFLENGYTDPFYKRIREQVKFVLMQCVEGWDTCFCVSMGTNKADDYVIAATYEQGKLLFEVKDTSFDPYFKDMDKSDFHIAFIEKNFIEVKIPEIPSKEVLNKLKEHKMWEEYNRRCIGCGSCTIACSTCTCFTTDDLFYNANPKVGERRRTTASCMIEGFDEMAGGHVFRKDLGQRYRYKVLHKIHDYKKRFGGMQMCVGCGRCTDRCPELISFTASIEKMGKAVAEIIGGEEHV